MLAARLFAPTLVMLVVTAYEGVWEKHASCSNAGCHCLSECKYGGEIGRQEGLSSLMEIMDNDKDGNVSPVEAEVYWSKVVSKVKGSRIDSTEWIRYWGAVRSNGYSGQDHRGYKWCAVAPGCPTTVLMMTVEANGKHASPTKWDACHSPVHKSAKGYGVADDSWSDCSKGCGFGTKNRTKQCFYDKSQCKVPISGQGSSAVSAVSSDAAAAAAGGDGDRDGCQGQLHYLETKPCNSFKCPIPCRFPQGGGQSRQFTAWKRTSSGLPDVKLPHNTFHANSTQLGPGIRWSSVLVLAPSGSGVLADEVEEVIRFRCMTGWQLVGEETLRCDRDRGEWTHPFPRCASPFQSLQGQVEFDDYQDEEAKRLDEQIWTSGMKYD